MIPTYATLNFNSQPLMTNFVSSILLLIASCQIILKQIPNIKSFLVLITKIKNSFVKHNNKVISL